MLGVAVVALALGVSACGSSGNSGPSIRVGAAGFSESQILANMYADLLNKDGYNASVQSVQQRPVYIPAMQHGDIQVMPEYAATLTQFLNVQKNGQNAPNVTSSDITKTMAALTPLAGSDGLVPLQPTQAVDQNAFAVKTSFAQQHNLRTLSDLGRLNQTFRLAAGDDCAAQPFCQPGLLSTYGIHTTIDPLGVDTNTGKQAVQQGTDDIALVTTTDTSVETYGLTILEDDKHLQASDNVVPLVTTSTSQDPKVVAALNKLAPVLTTQDLYALDKKVDQERQKPADVARDYLQSKGLI